MQELVRRVHGALTEPWHKKIGRPKKCGLYYAVQIALHVPATERDTGILDDLGTISRPTVSRIMTDLAPPLIKSVLKEFVPTAQEAIEMVNGKVCLVDGAITPC